MTIWCRDINCKNNEGQIYKDGKGVMGCCNLDEVEINRQGRCDNDNKD